MSDHPLASWRDTLKRRVIVAAAGFTLWGAAVEARLWYLQIVRRADLQTRAERQQMRTISVPGKRGEILDRQGRVLAYSVDTDSIYAVPTEIADPGGVASTLCAVLDRCSARERQTLAHRLRHQRAFAFVRRHVAPDEVRRVATLDLDGVGFLRESRRFYPNRELAAHLLGYVGVDRGGLDGIEAAYDGQIRGRPGTLLVQTDARRRAFSRLERPPTAGATLELSIDQFLQYIVERELRAGVVANRAAGGSAIIMDPQTGEILALANEPTFNPNAFRSSQEIQRRNRAVQDVYEPGSTFKVVTASAAIEEKVMKVDELVDVSAGLIRLGARRIDDVHRYGLLSLTDVIVKSSNVGAIKIGLRLGPERLGRYVRRFGFGRRLSPDFPGENPGIVWDPARWDDSALASVAMGYQVGVTPLQMATAVSAIANGGELIEPRIVRAWQVGGRRVAVPRRVLGRPISATTAAELRSIMEAVVERGTGQMAAISGFTVAGKTGTAAKLVDGQYSKSDYNASFVGFIPSRQPAVTILVVIDSPRQSGYYGGGVAAPIFKSIAEATLRRLGLGPTLAPPSPVLVVRRASPAAPAPPVPVLASAGDAALRAASGSPSVMPDLRGLGARDAIRTLARHGMTGRMEGQGLVVDQRPVAGAPLERGALYWLRLERLPARAWSPGSRP